jgi:uncharacterized membrane protein
MTGLPHPRFFLFLAVTAAVTAALWPLLGPGRALILGFDAGAVAFLVATLPMWFEDGSDAMRQRAARDDGGRPLLLLVSVLALAAVFVALVTVLRSHAPVTAQDYLQVVMTLVLAWLFVNTIYAHHYAHLYFAQVREQDAGGLDFPGREGPGHKGPVFSDFVYFAFVIGMTSQVSDVTIHSRRMRRAATLHGLMAFGFNLGVMALTINVLSGALSQTVPN